MPITTLIKLLVDAFENIYATWGPDMDELEWAPQY